jgi:hypothetical protein
MKAAAFRRALRAFSRRRPFIAFTIELYSGDTVSVRHPEAVIVRGNLIVCRHLDRSQRLFDSSSVCQLRDAPRSDRAE